MLFNLAEAHELGGKARAAARFYHLAAKQAAASYANDEALKCCDRAMALTPDSNLVERFKILRDRESLLALLGDSEARAADLAEMERLADSINDDAFRAQVAARQAAWREAIGDLPGAITVASMATRLAQLADLPESEADARAAWGRALMRQSHYRLAEQQLNKAIRVAEATGNLQLMANIFRYQGILAQDRNRFEQAEHAYNRALSLYQKLGDRQGQTNIHNNLGLVLHFGGYVTAAWRHWQEALDLFRELGDAEGVLRTLVNLGAASSDVGQYEEARLYLAEAIVKAQKSKVAMGEFFGRQNLGLVAHYQSQNETSAAEMRAAHQLAIQIGSQRLIAHALAGLGHALVELNQLKAADEAYWEALAIWEGLELPDMAAESRAGLVRSAVKQDNVELAYQLVEAILEQAKVDPTFGGAELPTRIYLTCYQFLNTQNDPRATAVLTSGQELLESRCANINDEKIVQSLRRNVPTHAALLAA